MGYGVLFAGIGFVGSFFIAYFLELKFIKIINWVLLITILAVWSYKYYQYQQRDGNQPDMEEELRDKPVSTEAPDAASIFRKGIRPSKKLAISSI